MLMRGRDDRRSGRCAAGRSPCCKKRARSANARSTAGCRTAAIRMLASGPSTSRARIRRLACLRNSPPQRFATCWIRSATLRQAMFCCEVEDPSTVEKGERIRDHEKPTGRLARHRFERLVKTLRFAHGERLDRRAQCLGGRPRLLVSPRHAEVARVIQHRHMTQLGHRLLEQLETLGREFGCYVRHAGEIAARPRQAVDEADGGCSG
jgi:hypothetical protein